MYENGKLDKQILKQNIYLNMNLPKRTEKRLNSCK